MPRLLKKLPLAEILQLHRRLEHLRLREAAKQAGVSYATISRVERGHMPDVKTVLALCKWLRISVEYAITGQEADAMCSRCVALTQVLLAVKAQLAQVKL